MSPKFTRIVDHPKGYAPIRIDAQLAFFNRDAYVWTVSVDGFRYIEYDSSFTLNHIVESLRQIIKEFQEHRC